MGTGSAMGFWLAVSYLAIVVVVWRNASIRAPLSGLILAYLINLAALHLIAPLTYLLPWTSYSDIFLVERGVRLSAFAMLGAGTGILMALQFDFGRLLRREKFLRIDVRLIRMYILIGLGFLIVFFSPLSRIPTMTAIVSTGGNLLLVGIALQIWRAKVVRNRRMFLGWIVVAFSYPLMTLMSMGFLGYGTAALVAIFCLVASIYRPRWHVLVASIIATYLGLSVFVTYMRDRREIRQVVWAGESVGARSNVIADSFFRLEPFDPVNPEHLGRINLRLNQSRLVGAAERYIEAGLKNFAHGGTIVNAFVALIPRALWPDKPFTAGSGRLVSEYTGIVFDESTSIGVGQVLEFFINFGPAGVILGFCMMGFLIATIDRAAGRRLRRGDFAGFAQFFVPGIALLQVGGSMMEVVTSAAAGALVVGAVNFFYLRHRKKPAASESVVVRGRAAAS